MKLNISKKGLIGILIIFSVVCLVILVVFLVNSNKKNYPKEPLQMNNLGSSNKTLDISDTNDKEIEDIPVYYIEDKVHISLVEQIITNLDLDLTKQDSDSDTVVVWTDGKNEIKYNSMSDSVSISLNKGITISRGIDGFKEIFKQYLGLEYDFVLKEETKDSSGNIIYYASRVLNGIPMEYGVTDEYTDVLKFSTNGNLTSANLLLAEVTQYDVYLPIITPKDLETYSELDTYPKEVYMKGGVLASTIDLDYMSDDWADIEDSLKDCKSEDRELILLYRRPSQGYLLPVYKYSAVCSVEYKGNEYSTPAIFYLNAADPNYVVR